MSINKTTLQAFTSWADRIPEKAVFPFEKVSLFNWLEFIDKNWKLSVYAGAIYVFTIFALQRWMKSRPPMHLRTPLFWWNFGLGIFSILGFVRTAPRLLDTLVKENGFYISICTRGWMEAPLDFWLLVFVASKFVELGDTLFIVLRKRPLVLLQWYHHVVTMNFVYLLAPSMEPIYLWFGVLNFGIHSLMYPYFALQAIKVKLPNGIAKAITTLQFCQMIMGIGLNAVSAYYYRIGVDCARTDVSIKAANVVYASFTVLFGKLFFERMTRTPAKEKQGKAIKED